MKIFLKLIRCDTPAIEVKLNGVLGDILVLKTQLENPRCKTYVVWDFKGIRQLIESRHLLNAIRLVTDFEQMKHYAWCRPPKIELYWQMTVPIPAELYSSIPK